MTKLDKGGLIILIRRASGTFEVCFREATIGNIASKCEEVHIHEDIASIFGLFFISRAGLKMDREKVQAIIDWPSPRNIFEVRIFHGLASFYRKFINCFSGIYASIVNKFKKDRKPFQWIV